MKDNRNSRTWILVVLLLLLLPCIGRTVSAQVRIELKPNEKSTNAKLPYEDRRTVPEASLPCSPEVAKWWDSLREASEAVKSSRGDKNDRKKFLALLQEGIAKSYQPPIPDRKPVVLSKALPSYTEEARRKLINGSITLKVEFLPDGTVGEVTPYNKLGSGLDEKAIQATRQACFLPAVKDGKFVSFTAQMEMSFNIY